VRLFDDATLALGPVTALATCAGITGGFSRVEDVTAETVVRVMAVNVIGTVLCAREAIRRMSTRRGGRGGAVVLRDRRDPSHRRRPLTRAPRREMGFASPPRLSWGPAARRLHPRSVERYTPRPVPRPPAHDGHPAPQGRGVTRDGPEGPPPLRPGAHDGDLRAPRHRRHRKDEGRDGSGTPGDVAAFDESGRQDSNLRPLGPESGSRRRSRTRCSRPAAHASRESTGECSDGHVSAAHGRTEPGRLAAAGLRHPSTGDRLARTRTSSPSSRLRSPRMTFRRARSRSPRHRSRPSRRCSPVPEPSRCACPSPRWAG
jgi:hypothetical protein